MPDAPAVVGHLKHSDIVRGRLQFGEIFEAGKTLFTAVFNTCDGQGRPATTGTGNSRDPNGQPAFIRTSAPDSNACAGCHIQPRVGGSGDFVANVFVLAQAEDPVIVHVLPEVVSVNGVDQRGSNERNTLGMNGAGPIEMLAREMTAELKALAAELPDGKHKISTKGVDFIIEKAGGAVIESEGVDIDLIIKPFHQAGVVRSIREFTVNAMNHHHGMQAVERFGVLDEDLDGFSSELTIGDITATAIFQAALGTPGRVLPSNPKDLKVVEDGEKLFGAISCTSCHVPRLKLNNPVFIEPNPLNPEGTFSDTKQSFSFDMTSAGEGPFLEPLPDGGAFVNAYTDLKRHNLCDDVTRHFCNEQRAQGRPDQDGKPGAEFFLTRKLWDVGNSAPYGHRGDLTTITEAILAHGGEARSSRDAFVALSRKKQAAVVRFLKTLQVLPPGSPNVVIQ